jgi:serine/threonine protein kinase
MQNTKSDTIIRKKENANMVNSLNTDKETATVEKTYTDNTVDLTGTDKTVELMGTDKTVELMGTDKTVELMGTDKTAELMGTDKTAELMGTDNTNTTKKTNTVKFLSNGSYGCVYENLSTPELMAFRDKTIESIMQLLKCMAPQDAPPRDAVEKKHTHTIDKIQFIELFSPSTGEKEEDFTEHRIVKETLYGETIRSIPNYYMYFAPILSSCPIDIDLLNTQDKMKCELFRETSTVSPPSSREKESPERIRVKQLMKKLYVNSKVNFVEGTALSNYFKKILWSDLPYKDGETVGQLSSFFVTRFIRSYRHLLKAVRLLQSGSTPNSIIIHHDLKDGNIIYDTKRGVPVIIDFGISFDKSVFEENTHPKKLGEVFYRYFNKYAPWSLDVVIMSYIAKVALLKKGDTDDSIKETYEKDVVAVDELKKVCDDFLENNEVLKWVDTLTRGGASATSATNYATSATNYATSATNYATSATNYATSATNYADKVLVKENVDQTKIVVNERITGANSVGDDRNGMTENEVSNKITVNSTVNKIKTQWYTYIESFNGKVWKDLVMDLSKRYALWDVYSLSVCYLQYIQQLELLNGKYQVPDMFMDFVEELKKVFEKTT